MRAKKTTTTTGKRKLQHESLEDRICLTASVGWDGPGHGSATLTYTVGQAPAEVGQANFESAVESALKVWSDVADIEFVETNRTGLADSIDFTFRSIDGKGSVLAQAYLPDDVNRGRLAGDVQFDSNETWEIGNARGSRATDLVWVAVHEIGHALGLDHEESDIRGAVMAASVSPQTSFSTLHAEDVDAILELYAPATTPGVSAIPTSPSSSGTSGSTDNTLNPGSTEDASNPTNESPTDHDTDDESETESDDDSYNRWRNWRQRVNRWVNRVVRRWRNWANRFDRGHNDSSSADQSQNESSDSEPFNTQVQTFRTNRGRLVRVIRFWR